MIVTNLTLGFYELHLTFLPPSTKFLILVVMQSALFLTLTSSSSLHAMPSIACRALCFHHPSHMRCYCQYPLFLSWDTLRYVNFYPFTCYQVFPLFCFYGFMFIKYLSLSSNLTIGYPINSRDYHR